MGQHIGQLLEKRRDISAQMLEKIEAWDKSADHAADIVEENDKLIEKLKHIEKKLRGTDPEILYDSEYRSNIEEIIRENAELLDKIREDKKAILDKLEQTGKSQKALKNYLPSFDRSIFINKDI